MRLQWYVDCTVNKTRYHKTNQTICPINYRTQWSLLKDFKSPVIFASLTPKYIWNCWSVKIWFNSKVSTARCTLTICHWKEFLGFVKFMTKWATFRFYRMLPPLLIKWLAKSVRRIQISNARDALNFAVLCCPVNCIAFNFANLRWFLNKCVSWWHSLINPFMFLLYFDILLIFLVCIELCAIKTTMKIHDSVWQGTHHA